MAVSSPSGGYVQLTSSSSDEVLVAGESGKIIIVDGITIGRDFGNGTAGWVRAQLGSKAGAGTSGSFTAFTPQIVVNAGGNSQQYDYPEGLSLLSANVALVLRAAAKTAGNYQIGVRYHKISA